MHCINVCVLTMITYINFSLLNRPTVLLNTLNNRNGGRLRYYNSDVIQQKTSSVFIQTETTNNSRQKRRLLMLVYSKCQEFLPLHIIKMPSYL